MTSRVSSEFFFFKKKRFLKEPYSSEAAMAAIRSCVMGPL